MSGCGDTEGLACETVSQRHSLYIGLMGKKKLFYLYTSYKFDVQL